MRTKHTLLTLALLSSSSVFAIPIESRSLSGSSSNNATTPVATAQTPSNLNWDLLQQIQRLENQVRDLRGKIDEQNHQIEQLNNELTNRYTDLDQRLELLKQKVDPSEETTENQNPAVPTNTGSTNLSENNTQTPVEGESNPPTTSSNGVVSPVNSPAVTSNVEQEKAAYTIALDAYKQGGAKKAIAPMQNFIKNNPNSVYTGNAYFWLGEFNLAIDTPNYTEAKKNYEIVASKFPNSAKAPRALYQLYSIAKDVNKNTQSAEVYKKKLLSTYPDSEEAGYFKKK